MAKYNIDDLLKKYQDGNINSEELAELESWYLQWEPEKDSVSDEEIKMAKKKVWLSMQERTVANKPWPWFSSIAGLIILGLLVWLLYPALPSGTDQQLAVKRTVPGLAPVGNKAILTLSGGERIMLNNTNNASLAKQGNVNISMSSDGKLMYNRPSSALEASEQFNTMTTPRGGQFQLELSDGTRVWLNAASSIKYPVSFAGKKREVFISGEVYFEVSHNKSMPFIVSTAKQQITVLGTHFNVSSYLDDDITNTTLMSGSIKIKNNKSGLFQMIRPGQRASISSSGKDIKVSSVNADDMIAWKNGYFLFDDQDIFSIMKVMSRWYDLDVEYKSFTSTERFGGTFSRKKNLMENLNSLEKLGKLHFTLMPDKIVVSN